MNVEDEQLQYTDLIVPSAPAAAPPPPQSPAPPSAPAPAAAAPPPPDTTPPLISGVDMRPELFRVARSTSPFAAAGAVRRGGRLAFRLCESAWMRLTISRLVVRRGGRSRCGRPARRHGGRVGRVGIFEHVIAAGAQTIPVSGRIRRSALSRGRYVLRMRAVDRAGNL